MAFISSIGEVSLIVIPKCQENLPNDLMEPLKHFAFQWAQSEIRPRPKKEVIVHWSTLIDSWSNDIDMPLFIRKASQGRGKYIKHDSGRFLIPVDNSSAHWAFYMALNNEKPSLEDIRNFISIDQIPVAMILKKEEKLVARKKCTLSKSQNLNELGWKVAHIEGVGLNESSPINYIHIETLKIHFRKLMSPENMFLIPLALEGLGEIPAVIDEIKKFNQTAND
jgi:hypothetical protein